MRGGPAIRHTNRALMTSGVICRCPLRHRSSNGPQKQPLMSMGQPFLMTLVAYLNLPALKGGDSGGTTVAASRVVRPSEETSGLATAYLPSNMPGFSRTTP